METVPRTRIKRCCTCGKHRYANEADALASALRASKRAGKPIHTYQCVGNRSWHIASRTHPGNVSVGRAIAYYLTQHRTLERPWLYQKLDIPAGVNTRRKKVRAVLARMEKVGLITRTDTRIDGVDLRALNRVVRVGIRTYIEEEQLRERPMTEEQLKEVATHIINLHAQSTSCLKASGIGQHYTVGKAPKGLSDAELERLGARLEKILDDADITVAVAWNGDKQ